MIPATVRVGLYTYTVIETPRLADTDGTRCWGLYRLVPQELHLEAEATPERKFTAFLHEAIHLIDEAYTIGLSEKQTNRLAVGLVDFLRDNGLLRDGGSQVT